jgi:cyanophycinase
VFQRPFALRTGSSRPVKGFERCTRARRLVVALTVCLGIASYLADPANDLTAAGLAAGETAGALVIVGGGGLPNVIRDRFLELAGGKKARLVVIPTASMRADRPETSKSFAFWKAQNVASVSLLHTRDPKQANDPAFVKPLTEATGVWLSGGDQARLVAAYHGTLVEHELQQVLARGGVIGGTSAGAAVMSSLMIQGGNPMARLGQGFGFLTGMVVDQHFDNRNRLNRLLDVLAKNPSYSGLGIDEQTAVVVKGHTLTVLGDAQVRLCLPTSARQQSRVQVLKSGEQIDLETLHPPMVASGRSNAAKEKQHAEHGMPAP